MMLMKYLVILLSLFSVNTARVVRENNTLIGGNPKTWSPEMIPAVNITERILPIQIPVIDVKPAPRKVFEEPVPHTQAEIDCVLCKLIMDKVENEACKSCPNATQCEQFIEKVKVCTLLQVCDKKMKVPQRWFGILFG